MKTWVSIIAVIFIFFFVLSPAYGSGIEGIPGETKEERVERLFFYISRWSREYEELSGPAIEELRSMGVEAVAMLMPHLESKDVRERVIMENLINGVGGDCTPHLVDALSFESPLGRSRAATYLGNVGDERSVQPLIGLLEVEGDWSVIEAAITGLGKLKTRGIEVPSEPIVAFAKHEMEPIRRAVVVALSHIGDEKAIPLHIEALNDELFSVRYPAAQALASFSDVAIEPLKKLLGSDDITRKALACYALGSSGSDAAYDLLKSALSSNEPIVRAHAVEGLKNLGNPRIRLTLLKMKLHETDQAVLGEIEEALEDL
jgi:hypothetical protein